MIKSRIMSKQTNNSSSWINNNFKWMNFLAKSLKIIMMIKIMKINLLRLKMIINKNQKS